MSLNQFIIARIFKVANFDDSFVLKSRFTLLYTASIKLMEALTRIPKVLDTIEDMKNNYDIEKVFTNYKANVKIFIENMKCTYHNMN